MGGWVCCNNELTIRRAQVCFALIFLQEVIQQCGGHTCAPNGVVNMAEAHTRSGRLVTSAQKSGSRRCFAHTSNWPEGPLLLAMLAKVFSGLPYVGLCSCDLLLHIILFSKLKRMISALNTLQQHHHQQGHLLQQQPNWQPKAEPHCHTHSKV